MVARALPANPVQLTFSTRTPREATVALRSRVVPRTSLESHPVLYRTLIWRLFFAAYNGSPIGDIRQTSIVEMDAYLLFHRFTKPTEWLIPLRDPVPPLGDWRDDLVDESNVRDLIEPAPWEVLASPLDPLTFKSRGWSGT
ncbi:hypothetical protein L916_08874 [Phytophthora nicotianae]|uniref:Uncharacterized protein n=1 Tax=Phytophthora nicotianae TaxID=4792 RepID=W2J096_PHYNI|nr:hypothetical protein L916_08874 [Phytophthora nicotianae]